MIDYVKLRHIVTVAQVGSFSRAAEVLNLTQPALSRSIAAFEACHGLRVFNRERTGVTPTSGGRMVIEQARSILSATGDLERSIRLHNKGDAGRIELGMGPLLASLVLPTLSRSLMRSRPNLQLLALTKPADQLMAELMEDRIELVFGNSWHVGHIPNVINEPVGSLRLAMIVRADHPLVGRHGLKMGDLASFPVATAVELPAGGLAGGVGAFICDNFHILRETVLETDCVWLSTPSFVAEEVKAGVMTVLEVSELWPAETELCMVSRQGRARSPIAAVVKEEVRGIIAGIAA